MCIRDRYNPVAAVEDDDAVSDGEFVGEDEMNEDANTVVRQSRRNRISREGTTREWRWSRKRFNKENTFSKALDIKKIKWGLNIEQLLRYNTKWSSILRGLQLYYYILFAILLQISRALHSFLSYICWRSSNFIT
eukprot:TRINITY_DN6324_c0_g2_i2.p2 TRINITY_DN6324_c0_g2~~TRINITY_DN6324_c0_g2_i2.p2  ORF type:complete len:151 (+),score=17.64 TRINITY_DN6324_c0_g2_i2:49-453(+)